ncbi:MAG TPA: hypothetical protein GX512_02350 [Firmicutes bacterium]|nr:hypothetical protein [Candidatus Fermentithermobacillaceae bacterium]
MRDRPYVQGEEHPGASPETACTLERALPEPEKGGSRRGRNCAVICSGVSDLGLPAAVLVV